MPITVQRFSALLSMLILFTGILNGATAQEAPNLSARPEDIALKEVAFDKSADAVFIWDKGSRNYDEQYRLITDRQVKLKILKQSGIERGNIRIPFYSGDNFENITHIEAVVFTPEENGSYSASRLNKKNIFSRQVNRLYSEVTFALPNVKVGSIIEYSYRSIMKSYGGLRNWEFQKELPVLLSSYLLYPIPNSEFAYTVYKKSYFPLQVVPNNREGRVLFEMQNLPGMRDEAYSTSPRQFLQRVNFQFSGMKYENSGKTSYMETWKQLATELSGDKNFGSQASKTFDVAGITSSLGTEASALHKMMRIHQYVRSNIVWDHISSKHSEMGVKNVQEKKKGNSADINLLLVSLLRSAGLETYPLLVSERHHGRVDTTYPYLDQFNKVVALVRIDGSQYVLDGTDGATPSVMMPVHLLNTIGFLVDKKKYGFVHINAGPHRQKERITISGTIDNSGTLQGVSMVQHMEYAKLPKEGRYKADVARYQDAFLKLYPFVKVDSFKVEGVDVDSAAISHHLQFHYPLQQTGGYYLLNYNLFTELDKSPFISDNRFSDIDFGSAYAAQVNGNFTLPSSMAIESIPASKTLVSPDRSMMVSRKIKRVAENIEVVIDIQLNRTKYDAEEYEDVKAFFKEMIDALNEPVVLKAKS